MNPDNLVGLQQSAKKVRNPFGADFFCMWNKQLMKLPGDGVFYTLIGRLAEHVARHLYMKARYQYHDEQVKKLKAAGLKEDARMFAVPAHVENYIWEAITGEKLHIQTADESKQEALDLSQLNKEMSAIEVATSVTGGVMNVSEVIEKGMNEAIAADKMGLAQNRGSAIIDASVPKAADLSGAVDLSSLQASSSDPITEALNSTPAPQVAAAPQPGFGNIAELDVPSI